MPSVATDQAPAAKRIAAFSAQMWARQQRHLAAIQAASSDILSDLCMPLDYALSPAADLISALPLDRVIGQR